MRKIFILLLIIFGFSNLARANAINVGRVEKAKGRVEIVKKGTFRGVNWKKLDGKLYVGDIVRTKRKSSAVIGFFDGTRVKLSENSRLYIEKYILSEGTNINVTTGKVIFKVSKRVDGEFKVTTPEAIIGVKGTEFAVVVEPGQTIVAVANGIVDIASTSFPDKVFTASAGDSFVIKQHQLPEKIYININEIIKSSLKSGNLNQYKAYINMLNPTVTSLINNLVNSNIEITSEEIDSITSQILSEIQTQNLSTILAQTLSPSQISYLSSLVSSTTASISTSSIVNTINTISSTLP
ncbi:FecR family protein [Desulfurobacterium sp.]